MKQAFADGENLSIAEGIEAVQNKHRAANRRKQRLTNHYNDAEKRIKPVTHHTARVEPILDWRRVKNIGDVKDLISDD